MAYTVKQLSKLSGVTIRTLHYYEEIGLLVPAYHGSNGYRYYEEAELLELQQILFFKELGFTLKQIQKVVGRTDFDHVMALHSHRKALKREWEKIGQLLKTIDGTIEHLKGNQKMKDQELFQGLGVFHRAKEDASYYAAEGLVIEALRTGRKPEELPISKETHIELAVAIFRELVRCIEKGLSPSSKEVQRIIERHHALAEQQMPIPAAVYRAYAQLYVEHPGCRQQLDPFHPGLAEFMAQAMTAFADRKPS
ncbi:MAG: MerR family transcriptional regulator [Chlamydiia bacterium]